MAFSVINWGSFLTLRWLFLNRSRVRPTCSFSNRIKFLIRFSKHFQRWVSVPILRLTQTTRRNISAIDKIVLVSSRCIAVIWSATNFSAHENLSTISSTIAKKNVHTVWFIWYETYSSLDSSLAYQKNKIFAEIKFGIEVFDDIRLISFQISPSLELSPTTNNILMKRILMLSTKEN